MPAPTSSPAASAQPTGSSSSACGAQGCCGAGWRASTGRAAQRGRCRQLRDASSCREPASNRRALLPCRPQQARHDDGAGGPAGEPLVVHRLCGRGEPAPLPLQILARCLAGGVQRPRPLLPERGQRRLRVVGPGAYTRQQAGGAGVRHRAGGAPEPLRPAPRHTLPTPPPTRPAARRCRGTARAAWLLCCRATTSASARCRWSSSWRRSR